MCVHQLYVVLLDSWSQIAPLTTGRTQHAGAAWNNLLFISGLVIFQYFFHKCIVIRYFNNFIMFI